MVKFDPRTLSAEQLEAMSAALSKDNAGVKRSPLTELGAELGIKLFHRANDGYTNDKLLVYIPRVGKPTIDDASKKLVPFRVPMRTVTLKKLNNGDANKNWADSMPYFEGIDNPVFQAQGQSGDNKYLQEFIAAGWDFRAAKQELDLARQGFETPAEAATALGLKEEADYTRQFSEYNFLNVSRKSEMWFPIVEIPLVKDQKTGKRAMKPDFTALVDENGKEVSQTFDVKQLNQSGELIVDAEGNPVLSKVKIDRTIEGTIKWHRLSTKSFDEKFAKAFSLYEQDSDLTELGGFFVLFDYTINEKALAEASKGGGMVFTSEDSKSGASLSIQVLPPTGEYYKLYQLTELLGLQDEWDRQAQEFYTETYLVATVRACALLSDEEVNAKLNAKYTSLDHVKAEIEKMNATAKALREKKANGGGSETLVTSASNRLGSGIADVLPPGEEVNPADSLDFGAE
jgi:hypothetical protein